MEDPKFNTSDQLNQTLEKLKEYVSRLLQKKKDSLGSKSKSELAEVLKSKSEKQFQQQSESKSFRDKMKEKAKNLVGSESKEENLDKGGFQIPPEDRDEYIPHDSEFGESLGENSRFAEIYPPYKGYYTQGKKSYFNPKTNLWSKRKELQNLEYEGVNGKKYQYAGVIAAGINAIPLPQGVLPITSSVVTHGNTRVQFQIDQNNCVYIHSPIKTRIAFDFLLDQTVNNKLPTTADNEKIIFDKLTDVTISLVDQLKNTSDIIVKAKQIQQHILKTKRYSTTVQGTLRNKSNNKNYIVNLDASSILECYSANTLFVALCRELDISARLIVGHMIQSISKDNKAQLSSNNGHAWSEIRDGSKWVRIDATPTIKEDGSNSDQNHEEQSLNQNADGNMDGGIQPNSGGMSPEQMLDELIHKNKEDNLIQNAENINEVLEKLQQAKSKEDIKKVLDDEGLDDFAKELIDKTGNDEIMKQEKNELDTLSEQGDEANIDEKLKKSLLNDEYRKKLEEYGKKIKEDIKKRKEEMRNEMSKLGFSEQELALYKLRKELDKETDQEAFRIIREFKNILPPEYQVVNDDFIKYRSGYKIANMQSLINAAQFNDPKAFHRNKEVVYGNNPKLFELIAIDRSGSMGKFSDLDSPFRKSVISAIIKAKVREHFDVDFCMMIYDNVIDEVISFGEKFKSKKNITIPARLMKVCTKLSGGNTQEPITHIYNSMTTMMKKYKEKAGVVSVVGDGDLLMGQKSPQLKGMIDELKGKKRNCSVVNYYLSSNPLYTSLIQYYFGDETDGGAIYAEDIRNFSEKLVDKTKQTFRKVTKKQK